jgi:hypothetical protein
MNNYCCKGRQSGKIGTYEALKIKAENRFSTGKRKNFVPPDN